MTEERAREQQASSVSLETLLKTSDIVTLHMVVSDKTRKLLNRETLALMQPGSLLVNTSRSSLIDTPALVSALQQGRPGFAALDVFETEPTDAARWAGVPNTVLTPHTAGATTEAVQGMLLLLLQNLSAHFAGEPLKTPVES